MLGVLKLEQPSGKCNGSIRTERAGNNRTVYPSRAESVLPETALISVALACKQAFCGTWTPSHTVTWSHREPVLRLIGSTDDSHLPTDRSGNQFWQLVPTAKLEKVNERALHFVFNEKQMSYSELLDRIGLPSLANQLLAKIAINLWSKIVEIHHTKIMELNTWLF